MRNPKLLTLLNRIKGIAVIVVGIMLFAFSIENYLTLTNSLSTSTSFVKVPWILAWAYDTLGILPASILNGILGILVFGYGCRVFRTARAAAERTLLRQ